MAQTLQELQKCLKPGGLLLVVDGDVCTLCEDRKTIMPLKRLPSDGGKEVTGVSDQGSWFRRLFWGVLYNFIGSKKCDTDSHVCLMIEACEACHIAGADLETAEDLFDLGLWDHPLCDPATARSGGVDLPIGPWAKSKLTQPPKSSSGIRSPERLVMWVLIPLLIAEDAGETQLLKYVGVLMLQNFLNVHRAFHSILLKHGMDQETLNEWSAHVDEGKHNVLSTEIFISGGQWFNDL